MSFFKAFVGYERLHIRGIPNITQALEALKGSKRTLGSFQVQPRLLLKEIDGDSHAPCKLDSILMKQQNVIDVDDAPYPELLEHSHKRAQQFSAQSRGLRYAETNCAPLHAPTRKGMAKTAVFSMGRMQTESKISIFEIHQHTIVSWLDSLCD